MKTLITAWEAVKYGPFKKEFPVGMVCNHIKRVERLAFKKCYLGIPFYNYLLSKLTDTKDIPQYSASTTYQKNAKICFEGCFLESLRDGNDVSPEDDANLDTHWKLCEKFTEPCLNELWECHLRYVLSLRIMYKSITYTTYQAGSKGLVKYWSEKTGLTTVSRNEFSGVKKELLHDFEDAIEDMMDWMVECTQDIASRCNFTNIGPVRDLCSDSACKGPKQRRRRRFYFKNNEHY